MTTVAWDGNRLAADGRSRKTCKITGIASIVAEDNKKLRNLSQTDHTFAGHQIHLIGRSGDRQCSRKLIELILRDLPLAKFERVVKRARLPKDKISKLIVLTDEGPYLVVYQQGHVRVDKRTWKEPLAIGSGAKTAEAFMLLGYSAMDAVRAASLTDPATNSVVSGYRYRKNKNRRLYDLLKLNCHQLNSKAKVIRRLRGHSK